MMILILLDKIHQTILSLKKEYIRIMILFIITINISIYLQQMIHISMMFYNVSSIFSIILISYLFNVYSQDILNKIYLNILLGMSIIGCIILNKYQDIYITRVLLLSLSWILLVFHIRLLNTKCWDT